MALTRTAAGCTNQACGFRDSYPDYGSLDFDVYCLSADPPAAQAKWQAKVRYISVGRAIPFILPSLLEKPPVSFVI